MNDTTRAMWKSELENWYKTHNVQGTSRVDKETRIPMWVVYRLLMPRANAKIERVWAYVGNCLRLMTDEEYSNFHMFVPIMALVYNNTIDSDTGMTPFQVEHGLQPECQSKLIGRTQ